MKKKIKIGDKVKIIGGNFDKGVNPLTNKIGIITSIDNTFYEVNGRETVIVEVELEHYGTHLFNDYHLEKL